MAIDGKQAPEGWAGSTPVFDVLQERKGDAPAQLLQRAAKVCGCKSGAPIGIITMAGWQGTSADTERGQKPSHLIRHAEEGDAILDHDVEQVALL